MSKKILAILMAVAMAFSLLPVTAFATDGPSDTTTGDVVDGHYNDEENWESGKPGNAIPDSLKDTVTTVDKTAEKVAGQDNQYDVTLKVEMKYMETAVPPGAAATVLVIDKSGSMNYCTDPTHTHTKDRYGNECGTWQGRTSRLSVAKTAAINFLKSYSGFSNSDFNENGSLKNNVSEKNLRRYVSLVTFNDSASLQTWGKWNNQESWIDVSTRAGYNKLLSAINDIEAGGGTNLDAALRLANTQMQSKSITQIDQSKRNVIALTDGVPTYYVGKSWLGYEENVYQHGDYGCPDTNAATITSATALKENVKAVYTVCFGAAKDKCWTEGSAHTWYDLAHNRPKDKHETDGPTVGDFLEKSIATSSTSDKQYAYNADDTNKLYEAFAAITQTITDGLKEGVVTDGLPTGVTAVEGSGFETTWTLDSSSVTPTTSSGYNVYTYTKTYKVNVDPAAVSTVKVGEVNYAPLNTPTTLTVQHNGSPVQIHFPIPAGKVTYLLTGFNKELVTSGERLSFSTDGFTIPANTTDPVVVSGEGVTLLYKITVQGNPGAKFTVRDDGATLVSPDTITDGENSTFSGTVGDTGETVFYVSKQFSKTDLQEKEDTTKYISNTATIAPGDNANGPADDKKTKTVTTPAKEPDPENYTVTYKWKEGTEVPEGAALPEDNPFTLNVGQKHTVAPVPTSSVKTNAAGKTGTWSCRWDKSGTIEGTANQEIVITGTWTFEETVAPKGTLTVTKKVEGRTLSDLSTDFTITVKDESGATTSTLTKAAGTATGDDTLTWTISGLTPGTYTVSEENAGVNGYTYTATYNATNGAAVIVNSVNPAQNQPTTDAQASQKVTVTADRTNTMTVTNTYTKNATVKLSDLIKKELTVKKGSDLPKNTTFSVTVTPKTANGATVADPQPIPGTVSDLGNGNTNGDGDTIYTASFNFGADGTLSLSAGTYTYTVQEDAINPISGMQYDSETYTLKITVPGNGEASYQATPITIKNTYQTPDLTVEKKTVSVGGKAFDSNPVAHVGEQIVWEVRVKNEKSTPARVTLTDAMAEGVYTDNECKTQATNVNWDATAHSWTATVSGEVTYYVNYTVKEADIPKGKIVNTILMKNGDEKKTANSEPVSTWDTKQLKTATKLNTSDWTTTVTLKLPTVSKTEANSTETEVPPDPITAISEGSKVEDTIGKKFTLVGIGDSALENGSFTMTVGGKEITGVVINGHTVNFGEPNSDGSYRYTVDYALTNNTFTWNINEDVYAGTEVTLSYKLKLTNPRTAADTYGVEDLNGDGKVDGTDVAVDPNKALYTNESAILYKKEGNTKLAEFPKPSVSYTISSGSSGSHSGGSRPSLNTKDHYGYIIGYPVDYYTGQPTTDQTKKPVRPEGKITRAEVATIYFRMLTDESRTKFWSQSNAYSDVKTGDWFNNAVSTLSNAGIIAGYEDGSFRPNGYITRAEFATIAARFFDVTYNGKDLFPDISGHWAKDYINQAANKGFVNGYEDGTFKPDRNITRAEAVTLVNRTLDRHPDKNHFTKDMLVWPDNMDQTKWYYADMQEATNSHTYQMKENSDKTKYENWTKTLPIRNWEALEKAWSNANSSQGNGNVV